MHTYCSKHEANFYSKCLWENWGWNRRKVLIISIKLQSSQSSKLKSSILDTSRCHVPVTDFVKSSKNLQHSNTPIENLTSEMEVKLKLQLKSLLEKSTFATFFQIYEGFIKDLTRELPLRAYVFVFPFLLYLQFEGNLFCRLPLIAYFDFDGFWSGSYFEEANVFQILSKSWKNACE